MNAQEQWWQGSFGNQYTTRNRVHWQKRLPFWTELVDILQPKSVLEVGCNVGWNLMALHEISKDLELKGVDVNPEAVQQAFLAGHDVQIMSASKVGDCLPKSYDLVFTAGVLIHIAPEHLKAAMYSIIAASKKYVLAIEYFAEHEEEVNYRGHAQRLWRRPFGKMYEELGLTREITGRLGKGSGWDDCTYWLLKR